jgi:hypothetical protein
MLYDIKKEKIKQVFFEWCAVSTSHGIPNIVRTNNLSVKVLWSVFVLLSTGFCSFMITRSVLDYLKNDVVTKIRVFKEIPAEFPVITICNLNPLTSAEADDLWNIDFETWWCNTSVNCGYNKYYHYKKAFTDYFQHKISDPSFGNENKKRMGQRQDEMIIDCNFATQKCPFNFSVSNNKIIFFDFSWSYSLNYGNCFRFNSLTDSNGNNIAIKKVIKDGINSELELVLYLKDQKNIPYIQEDRGFRLFIENQSHVPSTFDNGILVKAGTSTEISMKKLITERLPPPFSDCRSDYPDEPIYEIYKKQDYVYKARDCFNLCIQSLIIENCGCYSLLYDIHDDSIPVCDFYSECLRDLCNPITFDSLFRPLERSCFNDKANKLCASKCTEECYSVSYDITLSYSEYPNEKHRDYLKELDYIKSIFSTEFPGEPVSDLLSQKFAKVKIRFAELSYTYVSEKEKMDWIDLVANTGKSDID